MNVALVSVHKLRNVPTGEIIGALFPDGFTESRRSKSSSRAFTHQDGRNVFIHYHRSNDTIPRETLGNIILSARWTEEDVKRLKLV